MRGQCQHHEISFEKNDWFSNSIDQRIYDSFDTNRSLFEFSAYLHPDDPDDLSSLTSGHFLIGVPLIAVPVGVFAGSGDLSESRFDQWRHVHRLLEQFWKI